MVGRSDEGHAARLLAELFEALLVIDAVCELLEIAHIGSYGFMRSNEM